MTTDEHTLFESPANTWANTILFRLARAFGDYPVGPNGGFQADPDELLQRAEETIWIYQDLNDS